MYALLFDIDGTLIRAGKASLSAITQAFYDKFGLREPNLNVVFQGNTDYAIGRNLLAANDLPADSANTAKLWDGYRACLDENLQAHRPEVLPGVMDLVEFVLEKEARFFSMLMTGNMEATAWTKLRYTELHEKFNSGVFGDDHPDRNSLASSGLDFLQNAYDPEITPDRIVVIGDTINDVTCARSIGAKVIIVGTGYGSKDDLISMQPDLYVDDFTDPQVNDFLSKLES